MTQWVFGYKAGVGFDYFENYRTIPAGFSPPPERTKLVLNGTRTVRVRAVDSAGGPVPGIEIVPVKVLKKGRSTRSMSPRLPPRLARTLEGSRHSTGCRPT